MIKFKFKEKREIKKNHKKRNVSLLFCFQIGRVKCSLGRKYEENEEEEEVEKGQRQSILHRALMITQKNTNLIKKSIDRENLRVARCQKTKRK
jgi:hypothetical protein